MKYLRKFDKASDVMMFVTPNVVLVKDTGEIIYNTSSFGVYIQHIDGSLYTTGDWTARGYTGDDANGVAVMSEKARVVIAKTSSGTCAWSSSSNTLVDGIVTTSDKSIASTDYAGEENTALILQSDTHGAAYRCANFIFPNGAHGYLGAAAEWLAVFSYKTEVEAALTLIGGDALGSASQYWTSTQGEASMAWFIYSSNAGLNRSAKSYTPYKNTARAFTKVQI